MIKSMNPIHDNDLAAMSCRCQAIMAMPMKEITQIPFEDFASLYNSIQPTISAWTYNAADMLEFPRPQKTVVRCPSYRIKWAARVVDGMIEFNLRTMFYADLTWLKGCVIHELCHLFVKDHTKNFWMLYNQKIKEAEIVDVTYDGWKKERVIEKDDPFMFSHPGHFQVHRQKFNCMLNTFFHKGYTHCTPVKIDYKLLNDNS
ncbi:MAG: M48 family metallopeptidase [Prevotella sp.]|nr:M48 family metallopeptidase [Prevotella sp.]